MLYKSSSAKQMAMAAMLCGFSTALIAMEENLSNDSQGSPIVKREQVVDEAVVQNKSQDSIYKEARLKADELSMRVEHYNSVLEDSKKAEGKILSGIRRNSGQQEKLDSTIIELKIQAQSKKEKAEKAARDVNAQYIPLSGLKLNDVQLSTSTKVSQKDSVSSLDLSVCKEKDINSDVSASGDYSKKQIKNPGKSKENVKAAASFLSTRIRNNLKKNKQEAENKLRDAAKKAAKRAEEARQAAINKAKTMATEAEESSQLLKTKMEQLGQKRSRARELSLLLEDIHTKIAELERSLVKLKEEEATAIEEAKVAGKAVGKTFYPYDERIDLIDDENEICNVTPIIYGYDGEPSRKAISGHSYLKNLQRTQNKVKTTGSSDPSKQKALDSAKATPPDIEPQTATPINRVLSWRGANSLAKTIFENQSSLGFPENAVDLLNILNRSQSIYDLRQHLSGRDVDLKKLKGKKKKVWALRVNQQYRIRFEYLVNENGFHNVEIGDFH